MTSAGGLLQEKVVIRTGNGRMNMTLRSTKYGWRCRLNNLTTATSPCNYDAQYTTRLKLIRLQSNVNLATSNQQKSTIQVIKLA